MVIIHNSLQNVNREYHLVNLNHGNIFIMKFTIWLKSELERRNWNYANLARKTHMTEAAISLLMNEKRKPGTEMCKAIAKALQFPIEIVYRQAGLLPANYFHGVVASGPGYPEGEKRTPWV